MRLVVIDASALRGLMRRQRIDLRRADTAVDDYRDLPITRHGHLGLVERILGLRDNFSAYDAAYVALAEALGAALLPGDERLASAVRSHTRVPLAG